MSITTSTNDELVHTYTFIFRIFLNFFQFSFRKFKIFWENSSKTLSSCASSRSAVFFRFIHTVFLLLFLEKSNTLSNIFFDFVYSSFEKVLTKSSEKNIIVLSFGSSGKITRQDSRHQAAKNLSFFKTMTAKFQVCVGDEVYSRYDQEFHDCQVVENSNDLLDASFFSFDEAKKIKEEEQKKFPKAKIEICEYLDFCEE